MEDKNNKVNAFQLSAILLLMMNGLFVGIGIINTFQIAKQDAWIVSLVAPLIGLIFVFFITKIMDYKPDKNIIEKNKIIFGKIFGSIINTLLVTFALFILILVTWSNTDFVHTIYLTKTPYFFIAASILLPATYAVIKGTESIARVSEILFMLSIFIVGIIVTSLFAQMNIDDLKPVLASGYKPIIKATIDYLSFSITPILFITIIPKSDVINSKKLRKNMLIGYLSGALLMFFVFFLIPGVITASLASLYRFPAYYVLRKVMFGEAIDNIENFLSIHWLFNTFLLITMSLYFVSSFFYTTFKIKEKKIKNAVTYSIVAVTLLSFSYLFKDTVEALNFTKNYFSLYVASIIFFIIILTFIVSLIRSRIEKKELNKEL